MLWAFVSSGDDLGVALCICVLGLGLYTNLIPQASAQQGWPSEGWPWSRADVERKNSPPSLALSLLPAPQVYPCSQPLRYQHQTGTSAHPGVLLSSPRVESLWLGCEPWVGARRVEATFILPTVTFCYWNGSRLQNPHPHFSARTSRQLHP